jgi:transketolase C-terminal domain/subunit
MAAGGSVAASHSASGGLGNAVSLWGDRAVVTGLESLGFAQNFLSSCELEALHFIGIRSFGEEFREDLVFRGIQEKFRKPLA